MEEKREYRKEHSSRKIGMKMEIKKAKKKENEMKKIM